MLLEVELIVLVEKLTYNACLPCLPLEHGRLVHDLPEGLRVAELDILIDGTIADQRITEDWQSTLSNALIHLKAALGKLLLKRFSINLGRASGRQRDSLLAIIVHIPRVLHAGMQLIRHPRESPAELCEPLCADSG